MRASHGTAVLDNKEFKHEQKVVPSAGVTRENLLKTKIIRDAIREEDKRLRKRFPILQERFQDAVGMGIFLGTDHRKSTALTVVPKCPGCCPVLTCECLFLFRLCAQLAAPVPPLVARAA
jgi:hypothetical protein